METAKLSKKEIIQTLESIYFSVSGAIDLFPQAQRQREERLSSALRRIQALRDSLVEHL